MDGIKRILVVSRSTKYCRKAVHYGILLAKKHEAELYVIHAIHNPFGLEGWNVPIPSHTVLAEEYESMQQEAKTDLDNMINAEKANGLPIEVLISAGEATNKEVFRVVQEKKIDLLIMRAHKEWRLEHFLFGRSNEEIIRKMPCSIMLVKDEPKLAPY
jgi:nucleotide-binding universal stress UspA family protein